MHDLPQQSTLNILKRGDYGGVQTSVRSGPRAINQRDTVVRETILSSSRIRGLRAFLLVGLGVTTLWAAYRGLRFATITWCKFSLKSILKKVEADELDDGDERSLEGVKWSILWWINIML